MRKLYPEHPPLTGTDRFRFGKYRGRLVWEVIRDDPDYVAWLLGNLGGFRLAPDALDHLLAVRRFGL